MKRIATNVILIIAACSAIIYLLNTVHKECVSGGPINVEIDAIQAVQGRLIGLLSGFRDEEAFEDPDHLAQIVDECSSCYSVSRSGSVLSARHWRVDFDYTTRSGAAYAAYVTVGSCSEIIESGKVKIK